MTTHTLPLEGQVLRHANLTSDSAAGVPASDVERRAVGIDEANIITSEVAATVDFPRHLQAHRLVLDLDVPATLVPSSTEGHSHLYLDVPMNWQQATKVLNVLAEAGILEPGYRDASLARGYTAVRLPWVRKTPEEIAAKAKPTDGLADLFGGIL